MYRRGYIYCGILLLMASGNPKYLVLNVGKFYLEQLAKKVTELRKCMKNVELRRWITDGLFPAVGG